MSAGGAVVLMKNLRASATRPPFESLALGRGQHETSGNNRPRPSRSGAVFLKLFKPNPARRRQLYLVYIDIELICSAVRNDPARMSVSCTRMRTPRGVVERARSEKSAAGVCGAVAKNGICQPWDGAPDKSGFIGAGCSTIASHSGADAGSATTAAGGSRECDDRAGREAKGLTQSLGHRRHSLVADQRVPIQNDE